MQPNPLPPFDFFDRLLSYDHESGNLVWKPRDATTAKIRAWNTKYAGKIAGTINTSGYIKININQTYYLGHRIAWLLYHRAPPPDDLDHKNQMKRDNRICNLRCVSDDQNRQNVGKLSNNTSGCKGVCWVSSLGRWKAGIVVSGQKHFLGYFTDLEMAAEAYRKAAIRLHGEFACY